MRFVSRRRGAGDGDVSASSPAALHRSLPASEHTLRGRLIASQERIFGSNDDATAMYDFVPATKLKGSRPVVGRNSGQIFICMDGKCCDLTLLPSIG